MKQNENYVPVELQKIHFLLQFFVKLTGYFKGRVLIERRQQQTFFIVDGGEVIKINNLILINLKEVSGKAEDIFGSGSFPQQIASA